MAARTSGSSGRSTKRGSGSLLSRYGFILFSLVMLGVAAFLIYQGVTGTAVFVGRGSTFTHEITSNKQNLVSQGRVPFSADQHLLTAMGILALIAVLPIYLGRTLRAQLLCYAAGLAIEAIFLIVVTVVLIGWASTGHRYSNYLPFDYPESYVTPLAFSIIGAVLAIAATVFFVRLARRSGDRRPAVRPWG